MAVFSVVEAVLLRPLPLPEADRLVELTQRTINSQRLSVPRVDIPDLRREDGVFEDVGARALTITDVTFEAGGEIPGYAAALLVSYNYLSILGVQPILGRTFIPEDALPASAPEGGDAPPEAPPPPEIP